MVRVSNRHRQRVAEGRCRLLKPHAVLAHVGARFCVIPLERQRHDRPCRSHRVQHRPPDRNRFAIVRQLHVPLCAFSDGLDTTRSLCRHQHIGDPVIRQKGPLADSEVSEGPLFADAAVADSSGLRGPGSCGHSGLPAIRCGSRAQVGLNTARVKLLFDQNLAPRRVDELKHLFPGSQHVRAVGLSRADDLAVWEYGKLHRFTLVSKDADLSDVLEVADVVVDYARLPLALPASPRSLVST